MGEQHPAEDVTPVLVEHRFFQDLETALPSNDTVEPGERAVAANVTDLGFGDDLPAACKAGWNDVVVPGVRLPTSK